MRRWFITISFILISTFILNGCAALVAGGAAGVGTVAYIKGELREQLSVSPEKVRTAIENAVKNLELKELKADADLLSGDYVLKTGDGEKINVRYEKIKDRQTQISIRVGIFGDENLSHALLDEIKKGI